MEKAYTKNQIQISALLLGPAAAVYFLKKNFEVLGNQKLARDTLKQGILGILLFILITPFISKVGAMIGINIGIVLALGSVYTTSQTSLLDNPKYSFWNVLGISILGLIGFFASSLIVVMLYDALGLVKL